MAVSIAVLTPLEAITTYEVVSRNRDDLPLLRRESETVLTTGSYDIGENFQRFVETQLSDKLPIIASRDGMSAVRVLDELVKVAQNLTHNTMI